MGVLILTLVALILFANDRIPLQTSSLFVLCALIFGFHIFPYQMSDGQVFPIKTFFLGFGNEALIAVCAPDGCGAGFGEGRVPWSRLVGIWPRSGR